MKSINEELSELYYKHKKGIENIYFSVANSNWNKDLDGPFLMYCWEDFFKEARYKILFIGQEASGTVLGGVRYDETVIDDLIKGYKDFDMGKVKKNGPEYRKISAFWREIWNMNKILNPELENENCFLWTNVSKYCTEEGKPVPWDDHVLIVDEMNILQKEIEIVKPDIVIFFSGPNYDDKINIQFENKIKFEQVDETIPLRALARLKHEILPNHTYRTYHPNAHSITNKKYYIQLILGYCEGNDIINILNDFVIQLEELSKELKLEIYFSHDLGQEDSFYYFFKQEWSIGIGFGFDSTLVHDFFGGVCRRNLEIPLPENIVHSIQDKLGMNQIATENWPYRTWYDEHRNWNQQTFEEIKNGYLIRNIKAMVEEMLAKLKDVEL